MTITLCKCQPFTFYLLFHTSPCVDQYPIHAPFTCFLGLDPCARHSLFEHTDPYYTDIFYSSCGLKRPAATLALPLLCSCTVLPVPLSTGPYRLQLGRGRHYRINSCPRTDQSVPAGNGTSDLLITSPIPNQLSYFVPYRYLVVSV